MVLKIIWSHEHSCHIIKIVFQMILQKTFPEFFKIFVSLKFNQLSLFFDQLKCEREKWFFLLKALGSFNSWLIPFDQSSLFSCVILIPTRFLSTNRILDFKNERESDLNFSKELLSMSSIPLSIPLVKKKKKSFLWSKIQRFSSHA